MVSPVDKSNEFPFEPITADDTSQQIKRLDKTTLESDIPTKLVRHFDNFIIDYLQENVNNCLQKGIYPFSKTLKRLRIIQPIKRTEKQKNHTIDQLAFCLIYLKFMNDFYITKCVLFSVIFSLNIYIRKRYSVQHCLLAMTGKMKEVRDNNKVCAAVLTDLSKSI